MIRRAINSNESNEFIKPRKMERGDKLIQNQDLDSLFGHMEVQEFVDSVTGDLVTSLDDSNRDIASAVCIKTHHLIQVASGAHLPIATLPHSKIGVFSTSFGTLDIFVVLRNSGEMRNTDVKNLLYRVFTRKINELGSKLSSCGFAKTTERRSKQDDSSFTEVSGKILSADLKILLKSVSGDREIRTKDPVVYVETFGNKSSTITTIDNYAEIITRVEQNFSKEVFDNLIIDVCVSSSLGDNRVTLANDRFFDRLGIQPTHQLFFTDTVQNLYVRTENSRGDPDRVGEKMKSLKLNFYTTVKYKFKFDTTPLYVLPMTGSSLLTNFCGFRVFSNKDKLEKLVNEFSIIDQPSIGANSYAYRTEARCKFSDAPKFLRRIKKVAVAENFIYYETEEFFRILQENINRFMRLINHVDPETCAVTPDTLAASAIAECIMKVLFLAGNKTTQSILPYTWMEEHIQTSIPVSTGEMRILTGLEDTVTTLYQETDVQCRRQLVENQVKYAERLSKFKKKQLSILIDMFFTTGQGYNEHSMIKRILDLYVINSKNNDALDHEFLTAQPEVEDDDPELVGDFISKSMIHNVMATKATPAKIAYHFFKTAFNYSDDTAVLRITEWIRDNGVVSVISNRHKTRGSLIRIGFEKTSKSLRATTERKMLYNEFLKDLELPAVRRTRLKVDEETIVRFICGMFHYRQSESRITDLHQNLLFGFNLVRDILWVKNRIQWLGCCIKNKETLVRYIDAVKSWIPPEDIPESFLTDEKLDLYRRVYHLDRQNWIESDIHSLIRTTSPPEIFYTVVKNAAPYALQKTAVYAWFTEQATDNSVVDVTPAKCNLYEKLVEQESQNQFIKETPASLNIFSLVDESDEINDFTGDHAFEIGFGDLNLNTVHEDDDAYEIPFDAPRDDEPVFEIECAEPVDNAQCDKQPGEAVDTGNTALEADDVPAANNNVFDEYKNKLMGKHRYRAFNIIAERKNSFSTSRRLAPELWKTFVNDLLDSGELCKTTNKLYRFNLPNQRVPGTFIQYSDVFQLLARHYGTLKEHPAFTAYSSRSNLNFCSMYPSNEDWDYYLSDLAADNVLMVDERLCNGVKRYRLNYNH